MVSGLWVEDVLRLVVRREGKATRGIISGMALIIRRRQRRTCVGAGVLFFTRVGRGYFTAVAP